MSHTPGDPYCVGAWMSRNPTAVGPEELARQAYFTMRREGFRHLPVVEEGRLVGMVTDRDLRRPDLSNDPDGWNDDYRLSDDYTVRDLMTEKVLTASPKDPLERAIKTMQDARVGALPVLDKTGALIGILTTRDLMNALGAALAAKGEVPGRRARPPPGPRANARRPRLRRTGDSFRPPGGVCHRGGPEVFACRPYARSRGC